MAPLVGLAIKLAMSYAPSLLGKLISPKAEIAASAAKMIIDKAVEITGITEPSEAVGAIEASPELQLKFKESESGLVAKLAEEETKRQIAVLEQMGREGKSDKWYVAGWRPFNGYLFGITLFMDNMIMPYFIPCLIENAEYIRVAFPVYIFWAGVLGVNGYTRGKEKLERLKIQNGGNPLPFLEMLKGIL